MTDNAHMERAVLGSMLQSEESLRYGLELDSAAFSLASHRTIWSRMRAMAAAQRPIDTVTLSSELRLRGELEDIGGSAYLFSLTEGLPYRYNAHAYLQAIRKAQLARTVSHVCEAAIAEIAEGGDPEDVLARISATTLKAQMEMTEVRPRHISDYIVPALDEMCRQRDAQELCLGIPTGLPELDHCTTGWRPGELSYIGALPGRGKTSFLLQTVYAAATSGVGVGVISLEMQASQLIRRLGVMHSKLNAHKLRDARRLSPGEYDHAKRSLLSMGELPIQISDQSGLRPNQIASLARQMYEEGARLIVVDFVQIISEDGRERREAINRVSASLRDTCKALNVPFVVASQLARRDADPNRRPTIQDLRESGNLEQDAHNVLLIYRPKDKGTGDWTGEDILILDKQREGLVGDVLVHYDEDLLMFRGRQRQQQTTERGRPTGSLQVVPGGS